jgi:transcriptional regulator with XRE-family HTH domain
MQDDPREVRRRVGRNVLQLREARGWSQEQLAEHSGRTVKIVGQVERGATNVTIDKLASIANGLSVNIADLFRFTGKRSGERVAMIFERDLKHVDELVRVLARARRALARRDRG